jgi:hypothetical protein
MRQFSIKWGETPIVLAQMHPVAVEVPAFIDGTLHLGFFPTHDGS